MVLTSPLIGKMLPAAPTELHAVPRPAVSNCNKISAEKELSPAVHAMSAAPSNASSLAWQLLSVPSFVPAGQQVIGDLLK